MEWIHIILLEMRASLEAGLSVTQSLTYFTPNQVVQVCRLCHCSQICRPHIWYLSYLRVILEKYIAFLEARVSFKATLSLTETASHSHYIRLQPPSLTCDESHVGYAVHASHAVHAGHLYYETSFRLCTSGKKCIIHNACYASHACHAGHSGKYSL